MGNLKETMFVPKGAWASVGAATAKLLLLALCCQLCACAGSSDTSQALANAGGSDHAPPVRLIDTQLIKQQKQQRAQRSTQDISSLVLLRVAPYAIGAGDILSIVVWDHPELAGAVMLGQSAPSAVNGDLNASGVPPAGFVVDHEGQVQFPFAGLLKVGGLTEEQARDLLSAKLARYIHEPKVTLRVQAYRSKRIYIDGEVKAPGLQAINDIPMTLVEALNRAGGFLPTADQSRVVIERAHTSYAIDMPELMSKGVNLSTIVLRHGDVVRVLSRDESKVFVSGEVITPKSLTMHNGRLTLNEAMGESGGISPLGDTRQVYVVRKADDGAIVYQLDARSPGAMAMAEQFELSPRDVVYVAASPLANWHRNISLLFPGELSSALGAVKP